MLLDSLLHMYLRISENTVMVPLLIIYAFFHTVGKASCSLTTHPKRDKLLSLLPDLHSDTLISQYVYLTISIYTYMHNLLLNRQHSWTTSITKFDLTICQTMLHALSLDKHTI